MTEKLPIITVTCFRDLALLDLQAQSISQFLAVECPVYLIVNEKDPSAWFEYFDKNIRHYYSKHNLTILTLADFQGDWDQWIPSKVNPWAVGWETQQILKLAIALKIKARGYLILDTQNFLIKVWDPNKYDIGDKIPRRWGPFSMPHEIWHQYAEALNVDAGDPKETIAVCTPFFMNTNLVQTLIAAQGGEYEFTRWFKNASKIKSEFILYVIWAIKQNAVDRCHQEVDDWASPYLRDSDQFSTDFEKFIGFVGVHHPHAWISVNHRSWGLLSHQEYIRMCNKMVEFNLFPHFEEYRKDYVDIKF